MARVEEAVGRLGKVDLFEGLPTGVLLKVAMLGEERTFDPGTAMVREGESGGGLFVIFEGEAWVTVGGQERARLSAGDYFGEISLLDDEPRSATVTAHGTVRAFSLPSFTFRPLLEEHFEVADRVILRLCQRLRAAEHPIAP